MHAALDLNVDMPMPIVDQGMELIVLHDVLGEHHDGDLYVGVVLGFHGVPR